MLKLYYEESGNNEKNIQKISLIICLIICTLVIKPFVALAAGGPTNLSKDSAYWKLDYDTCTMHVYVSSNGNTTIPDFADANNPNSVTINQPYFGTVNTTNLKPLVKHVYIDEGITYIGNFAFAGGSYIEDYYIADSVEKIGTNAISSTATIYAHADTYAAAFAKINGNPFVALCREHTPVLQNAKEETCTTDGYTGDYVCSVCGALISSGQVITTPGHVSDSGIVTKKATCTTSGTRVYSCSVCSETLKTEIIPATGHVYGDEPVTTEPTCTEAGYSVYKCEKCGNEKTVSLEPTGHTPVKENSVEPTCVEPGHTAGTVCSVCQEILSGCDTINATGHSMVHHDYVAASCTATGLKEYWECSVCNKKYSDEKGNEEITDQTEIIIPEIPHSYQISEVPATCTKSGVKNYTCSCGKHYSEIIKATGHKYTIIGKAIAATYFTNGKSAGKKCKVCGKIIEKQKTIAKKCVTVTKVKALKSGAKIYWKKVGNSNGYQIQYSLSKKMTKASSVNVKNSKSTSYAVKKLKSSKKYYFRTRAYKIINGKRLYSGWSKIKSIVVK